MMLDWSLLYCTLNRELDWSLLYCTLNRELDWSLLYRTLNREANEFFPCVWCVLVALDCLDKLKSYIIPFQVSLRTKIILHKNSKYPQQTVQHTHINVFY